jgi:hypothetical protein
MMSDFVSDARRILRRHNLDEDVREVLERVVQEVKEKDYREEEKRERAYEAGMLYGVEAYNDAMGYSLAAPEPCGHHCMSDCPRCGE